MEVTENPKLSGGGSVTEAGKESARDSRPAESARAGDSRPAESARAGDSRPAESARAGDSRSAESARAGDSRPAVSHRSMGGNESDCDRNERHPLITGNGRDRPPESAGLRRGGGAAAVGGHHRDTDRQLTERRGRRESALREARSGYESALHRGGTREARSGYESALHRGGTREARSGYESALHRGGPREARSGYESALHRGGPREACSGYESAWHSLSGYERAASATYESAPHPISGYERLSVERAHTMKDFEKQITELKKENFNLKLRIYFLEEQVQRESGSDELHRMNIELKVEVESLKHDFQEKQELLVRASTAMESLAGEHGLSVQHLREEHLKHLQDMEDAHGQKIHLLEAEIRQEKAELEKMCALLDQERGQRFAAEERLLTLSEQCAKSAALLEERDWIIQCLNESVHSKDSLIAQLEKQVASMTPNEASSDKTGKKRSNLFPESDATPEPICIVDGKEDNVNEWQQKIKEMDNLINELQQKLEANKAGSAAEEENSLKRDKAIQGLTLALKKKSKENDKLLNDIHHLNAALSKAREAAQQTHLQEDSHPHYKKLVFTLQAEQDMYGRLLKYERESGSLQKELESIAMLRRWLEENILANQELRKIMEAQIMAKYAGEDSMSFCGDQTSYLSICLDHLDRNEYFYAGGPQGAAVSKNNGHVGNAGELFDHLREEAGTQTQREVSSSAGGNLDHQQHYKSDVSFSERSAMQKEEGVNDAKLTRNQPTPVSSATQTESPSSSDKCISANASSISEERAELMWTLQDEELNVPSQRLPQKTRKNCEIQGYKQRDACQNAKKSRLPVLLKSSLITKLKTDPALTPAKERHHRCLEKELQIESGQIYEPFKCAKMNVESLKEIRDSVRDNCIADQNHSGQSHRDPTEQAVDGELLENRRLSQELERAERESETLNENVITCKESDLQSLRQRESTERALKELQAENHRLSEQLKQAQMDIETLKASEELLRCKVSELDLYNSKDENRKLTERTLQKELQAEDDKLSEQLEQAQREIETLKANEDLLRCTASEPDLPDLKDEQRNSSERALQKENDRLSEQLKQAHVEIETLKAYEELIKHKDTVSGFTCSFKDLRESSDQSLQEELQAEKCRLSEQLKTAQTEIEKLRAERRSTDSSDDSLKLHGSDADDDLSEQSFLDKTITNSVNVNQVDATSDFGDDRPHVISQNAVALRCHHDHHCTECANNRGILLLPTSNSTKASTMHTSSKFTKVSCSGRSFEDSTSLSKYDLLVQSQARELSLQRQKIKESHNLSVICSKNFYNVLKAFENLFPASALDSNITLGFQEQITQTVEWLKELEYKLSDAFYGEEDAYSDHSVDSLLFTPSRLVPGHRMWADKHGCHVLGLVEDYNALRKQILEARNVLQEVEAFIDHGVQTAVLNMTEHFGNIFFEKLTRTKQSLEEAGCLLKLLWRVSLPLQIHISREEDVNLEITRLRKRVLEQEKLLSGMVKRVYSENQVKEDIEKLILDQLAMTHDILKRAKGNLEVQVVDKLH